MEFLLFLLFVTLPLQKNPCSSRHPGCSLVIVMLHCHVGEVPFKYDSYIFQQFSNLIQCIHVYSKLDLLFLSFYYLLQLVSCQTNLAPGTDFWLLLYVTE
jgi:hypothetical protein